MFNNFSKNHAVYEITWKNMVEPERPQMTIKYGACALRAGAAGLRARTLTLTLSECNTYCCSMVTMVSRKRLNVT